MSSNASNPQHDKQETGESGGVGVVPLTFGQKKKTGAKPKVRVRPNLKKRKVVGKPSASAVSKVGPSRSTNAATKMNQASASVVVSATDSAAGITQGDGNVEKSVGDTTSSSSLNVDTSANTSSGPNIAQIATSKKHESSSAAPVPLVKPVARASASKNSSGRKIGKILPRKPLRKPIKPSRRMASANHKSARKGLGIAVGSSFPQQQQRRRIQGQQQQQQDVGLDKETTSNAEIPTTAEEDATTADSTPAATTSSTTSQRKRAYVPQEEDLIPYQHLGQIDPALNIAAPKPGEKSMKDFCSKFKLPKAERGKKSGANAPASGDTNNNDKDDNGNNKETGEDNNNPNPNATNNTENDSQQDDNAPSKDNRSGPLVEIINGEIVVQESSMIVGGRQTTEEVDRELEGTIVVEENTGITATYNSFTKRQKTQRWSVEETRNFFMALRQCGTDFTTMENFFDGRTTDRNGKKMAKRTRKQLKSKYLRECKKNLHLIDMAMNPKVQLPLDMSVFGELDMAAVQDSVVPLGQATAAPLVGVVTPATSASPSLTPTPTPENGVVGVDGDEMQVVVEDAEQENAANANAAATAAALVTQEDAASALSEKALDAVLGVTPPSALDALTQTSMTEDQEPEATTEEVNNVPLLAMPTGKKKKQRPKFRARAKKPKAKGKPKRAVK